jgi:hypothetical protein
MLAFSETNDVSLNGAVRMNPVVMEYARDSDDGYDGLHDGHLDTDDYAHAHADIELEGNGESEVLHPIALTTRVANLENAYADMRSEISAHLEDVTSRLMQNIQSALLSHHQALADLIDHQQTQNQSVVHDSTQRPPSMLPPPQKPFVSTVSHHHASHSFSYVAFLSSMNVLNPINSCSHFCLMQLIMRLGILPTLGMSNHFTRFPLSRNNPFIVT